MSGIALENGINANVLFRWLREQVRASSNAEDENAVQAVLLPVKLEATTARSPVTAGLIEIDIGAARVRLRGVVDEANVRCVLQDCRR